MIYHFTPSVILCLLSLTSVLSFHIQWGHNLQDNEKLRNVFLTPWTIGNYLPAIFGSTSTETTEGIFGCVYAAGNSNTPPFFEMGLFQPATLFSRSAWAHTSDYKYATNYIGGTFMALEEWSDNTLVQSITLNYLPWSYTTTYLKDLSYTTYKSGWTGNWGNSNQKNAQQGQQQGAQNGQQQGQNGQRPSGQNSNFKTFGNLNVTIAIAVANRTGELTSGRWVTGKSLNLFIEVYDFPYINTANSIHLTFGLLSGSNQTQRVEVAEDEAQHTELMGIDEDAVFANFPKHAVVDDHIVKVKGVSNFSAVDNDLFNWKLTTIIKPYLVGGGLTTVSRTYRVIFPSGAKNITYEPTYGIHQNPLNLDGTEFSWISVTVIFSLLFLGVGIIYIRLLKDKYPFLSLPSLLAFIQGYRQVQEIGDSGLQKNPPDSQPAKTAG